ncbi:flavin monoamine oxidase family protein [Halobacillus mangrovi]|uniref:flavin monoamine oxidase family protein n=1 Tax=Halobacillus mangrovi TaxID=402384 RepID=UPI00269455B7
MYSHMPHFRDQYPEIMVSVIRQGIGESTDPKRVLIIGAGMAGLVAGSLLKEAGHQVTILEANNRVDGRVFTKREPFSQGAYLDFGAMRIPDTHHIVFEYIKKFQLPTNRFLNTSKKDLLFVNGVKTTREIYEKNPDILQFPLEPNERGNCRIT